MSSLPRAWMSWSSGKDSAFALDAVRLSGEVDVVGLVTTVNSSADRVAMHAVRRGLLEAQAVSLGLPVHVIELPFPCSNEQYEKEMSLAIAQATEVGVSQMIYGDLYLEDVRSYREKMLSGSGITPSFPLWGRSTHELVAEMVASNMRAIVTCVDPTQAPAQMVGRSYDASFLADLPKRVDPCGENGEFHTFVANGPGFSRPLDVAVAQVLERDGFVFADVVAL